MQLKLKRTGILFVFMFSMVTAFSQNRVIKGKVTDTTGFGLVGAHVIVKGALAGTVTNSVGEYSISASGTVILIASFTGCTSAEVSVSGSVQNFILNCSESAQRKGLNKTRKKNSSKKQKQKL